MDTYGYSATDISITTAIGGVVSLPFAFIGGYLSDHVGRVQILVVGFLACIAALVVLSFGSSLWHFWLAVSLLAIERNIVGGVGSALAADLSKGPVQTGNIALVGSVVIVGGIFGYAIGGYMFDGLGIFSSFLLAVGFSVVGTILLLRIGHYDRYVDQRI
jgi:MFS family permease